MLTDGIGGILRGFHRRIGRSPKGIGIAHGILEHVLPGTADNPVRCREICTSIRRIAIIVIGGQIHIGQAPGRIRNRDSRAALGRRHGNDSGRVWLGGLPVAVLLALLVFVFGIRIARDRNLGRTGWLIIIRTIIVIISALRIAFVPLGTIGRRRGEVFRLLVCLDFLLLERKVALDRPDCFLQRHALAGDVRRGQWRIHILKLGQERLARLVVDSLTPFPISVRKRFDSPLQDNVIIRHISFQLRLCPEDI